MIRDNPETDTPQTFLNATECCQYLIQQPSITPHDAGCQAWLAKHLAEMGFQIQSMPSGDTNNLFAIWGNPKACLLFMGHTDVVPVNENNWSYPPFAATQKDNRLIGRGAVDMKGAIAAMLTACQHICRAHTPPLDKGIAWLITSDEEGPGIHGTKPTLDKLVQQGLKADYCLVGEPTSQAHSGDTIKIGRRGSLNATLTLKGNSGHVAYPEQCDNPTLDLQQALNQLTSLEWPTNHNRFPPTHLQITAIQAGCTQTQNVTPSHVQINFNIRYAPPQTADELIDLVQTQLAPLSQKITWDWRPGATPYDTLALPQAEPWIQQVTQSIIQTTGQTPAISTNGGTSDGRFAALQHWPVIELGLPQTSAHQADEWVSIPALNQLTDIYQNILSRYLHTPVE